MVSKEEIKQLLKLLKKGKKIKKQKKQKQKQRQSQNVRITLGGGGGGGLGVTSSYPVYVPQPVYNQPMAQTNNLLSNTKAPFRPPANYSSNTLSTQTDIPLNAPIDNDPLSVGKIEQNELNDQSGNISFGKSDADFIPPADTEPILDQQTATVNAVEQVKQAKPKKDKSLKEINKELDQIAKIVKSNTGMQTRSQTKKRNELRKNLFS